MIYVRWKRDETRRGRVFPSPAGDDALYAEPCPVDEVILGGEAIQLIAVGPTSDDEQARHDEGRWYNAGAIVLHARCAERLTDRQLDELCSQFLVVDPDAVP